MKVIRFAPPAEEEAAKAQSVDGLNEPLCTCRLAEDQQVVGLSQNGPIFAADAECPVHGWNQVINAIREAVPLGPAIEVDLAMLGPVCGGSPWSPGDMADFIAWAAEGKSESEIAGGLQRSIGEVRAKAEEAHIELRGRFAH